jgi:hypothetical protein
VLLTWALDEGEWSASRLGRFTPRERAHGTHLIWGWVGPRAGLDAVAKRQNPCSCWDSNPGLLAWATPAPSLLQTYSGIKPAKLELSHCVIKIEIFQTEFQSYTLISTEIQLLRWEQYNIYHSLGADFNKSTDRASSCRGNAVLSLFESQPRFPWISSVSSEECRLVLWNRPWTPPSKSFSIHHSNHSTLYNLNTRT